MGGAAAFLVCCQAAQAEMSDGVIRIGVLNDRSGIYAAFSGEGSVVAARMAAEEFGNEINGVPIEIVFGDHHNDPAVGADIAHKWIVHEGVDAIADVPTSSVALEVQRITRENNAIFLIGGAAAVDLSGHACSPNGFHWVHDTHALAHGTAHAIVEEGGDSWFFLTVDDVFGHSLEEETSAVVKEMGGKVLGAVRHPLDLHNHDELLAQAVNSGAKVIGLANGGTDATDIVRDAHRLGILKPDQHFAGLLLFINDIHALGLEAAQGMMLTVAFYWNRTEETAEWSRRFFERHGEMPSAAEAGTYSAVRHYLKAIEKVGTDEAATVAETMRAMPVNDIFATNGHILANGRMVHDMYLVEVKSPEESKEPWDYYKVIRTIPGEDAFHKEHESGCPLVK